jgi:nucleoid DNA-binding protein
MHKEEFIKQLARKNRRPKQHYRDAITEIFAAIEERLADGKEVCLTGFGTFYTRMHKGGKGRNFKTKQPMEYKAVRLAAFRPGMLLKQAVRRKKGLFGR